MYRVLDTTSSRVPCTRPGRPSPGCSASCATASSTRSTTRRAATESSAAIKDASSSRLRSAVRSHLTRIHFPLLRQGGDVLVAGKGACIGFLESRLNLADLPLVCFDESSNRFSGEKGLAALGRVGEDVEAILDVVVEADGHRGRHVDLCLVVYNIIHTWALSGQHECLSAHDVRSPPKSHARVASTQPRVSSTFSRSRALRNVHGPRQQRER